MDFDFRVITGALAYHWQSILFVQDIDAQLRNVIETTAVVLHSYNQLPHYKLYKYKLA